MIVWKRRQIPDARVRSHTLAVHIRSTLAEESSCARLRGRELGGDEYLSKRLSTVRALHGLIRNLARERVEVSLRQRPRLTTAEKDCRHGFGNARGLGPMHALGHLARQRVLRQSFLGFGKQRSLEQLDLVLRQQCEPAQVRCRIAVIDVDRTGRIGMGSSAVRRARRIPPRSCRISYQLPW